MRTIERERLLEEYNISRTVLQVQCQRYCIPQSLIPKTGDMVVHEQEENSVTMPYIHMIDK